MTAPADSGYTPDPAKPDLSAFAAAVRFRDRATAAAVAYHERVGLPGSTHYARATFDAIAQTIREDERERLAQAGRLVPPDADTRPDGWAVRVTLKDGTVNIRHGDEMRETRESAEQMAFYACQHPLVSVAEVVTRREWVGPWLPTEPTCSCPDIDVTIPGERPGSRTVKGLDRDCPIHREPTTDKESTDG